MIEVVPPVADGDWWLVQCHACREIVGDACKSDWEAQRRADRHAAAHQRPDFESSRIRRRLGDLRHANPQPA